MIQYVCDMCGLQMGPEAKRFCVAIEGYSSEEEERLISQDILSEMGEAVDEGYDPDDGEDEEGDAEDENVDRFHFDFCEKCYLEYVKDPLRKARPVARRQPDGGYTLN